MPCWLITKRSERALGILHPTEKVPYRATFIVDPTVSSGGWVSTTWPSEEREGSASRVDASNWRTLPCNGKKAKNLHARRLRWVQLISHHGTEDGKPRIADRSRFELNSKAWLQIRASVILKREWSRQPLRKPPVPMPFLIGRGVLWTFGIDAAMFRGCGVCGINGNAHLITNSWVITKSIQT